MVLGRALGQIGDSGGARREGEAALGAVSRLGAGPDIIRAERALKDAAAAVSTPTVAQRTLFFSDIVGSTQLVEAIGDEALAAWSPGWTARCGSASRPMEAKRSIMP